MDNIPIVEREVVRLIVLDAEERILLFRIYEPFYPEEGTCWELPGGGIDEGETYVTAALRELHEETGITTAPEQVSRPIWSRRATFRHAGERRVQNEVVVTIRLNDTCPSVDESNQLADEQETYFGYCWWSTDEIEASAERFYPGSLQRYIRRVLDGERIDEPFEHFS
jgi:8-oxo-dGTP pyrophosphatase MutT (NUDIX family)